MASVDGIAELHMSGARAVFRMESGAPNEVELAAAFKKEGMELTTLESVQRPRAQALYLVDAGVT